jgi:hypothetical protein
MRNEASYTAFIQGIYNIAIKTKVHVDNFEAVIRLAERLERVSKSLNQPHSEPSAIFAVSADSIPVRNTQPNEPNRSPDLPQERPTQNNRSNRDYRPQERRNPQNTTGKSRLKCYHCGRENHVMRNCYQLRDDLRQGSSLQLQELIDRTNNRHQNRLFNGQRAGQRNPAETRPQRR